MVRVLSVVLSLLFPALLLVSCSGVPISSAPTAEPLDQFPQASVKIETDDASYAFKLWVADTPPRRDRGLQQVTTLASDHGMLFLYPKPTWAAMWMHGTPISLDLIFVARNGRVVSVIRNTLPYSYLSIEAEALVTGVIELPAGTAKRLRIAAGSRVRHPHFGDGDD